ncbi:hypothetical protein [Salinicola halophyticus]|uniref:hypothetical protein n=1 Tax=Salinicola halophyticus TaxID=1808881 RepID=UPI000DA17844|nr:hypothetical protein [Salinicola halophyticus]
MALDPKRLVLCWPNYIDQATVSGGDFKPSLPLANVQDRRFAVVAKTNGLEREATQMLVQLDRRRPVAVVALPAHNLSSTAKYRVRLYRTADATDELWDSGERDVWPIVYGLNDVIWGNPNFWNRRMDESTRETYTPLLTVFPPDAVVAQAVRIELYDPRNVTGAITLGRVFISDAWQPEYNMSYGVQYGHNTGTQVTEAKDRARTEYFDDYTPKRTVSFQLEHLDELEAFLSVYRLQRTEDIRGEILFLQSTASSPVNFSRTMLARQTSLDPLVNPYLDTHSHTFNLQEIL